MLTLFVVGFYKKRQSITEVYWVLLRFLNKRGSKSSKTSKGNAILVHRTYHIQCITIAYMLVLFLVTKTHVSPTKGKIIKADSFKVY